MKTAFAILFSFLLVVSQSVLAVGKAVQPTSATCGHCACGDRCCVSQSSPVSQSLPAAPARAGYDSQSSWLLAPATLSYCLPAAPPKKLSSASSFVPTLAAVPLYQRNCAYLI